MPVEGTASQNQDKTMDYSITAVKQEGDVALSAGAFVNNYRTEPDKFNPHLPQYSVVGGSLGVSHVDGHAASLTAQHIPTFGQQLTAASQLNVLKTDNVAVNVNSFITENIPRGPMPSFKTHGGGIDCQIKDTFNAGASVSRTPAFNQTNYGLTTGLNLHKTAKSSFDVNLGAHRTDTQYGRGKWEPKIFLGYRRQF